MLLVSLLLVLVGGILLAFGILVTNIAVVYTSMGFAFVALLLVVISALPHKRKRGFS